LPSFQSAGELNRVDRDQFGKVRVGRRDAGSTEIVDSVLTGKAFFEGNDNGVQDSIEKGIVGARVFIDINYNGFFDSEPFTTTLADAPETSVANESGDYQIESQLPVNFRSSLKKKAERLRCHRAVFQADGLKRFR